MILRCMSPEVARFGRADPVAQCLLLGDERPWLGRGSKSENDPKRLSRRSYAYGRANP
jgi:hypothetical protein